MKSFPELLAVIWLLSCGAALADSCTATESLLVDVISEYSESTGTQFILDPRVRAKVNIVGRGELNIDAATLNGILSIRGFAAYESNGVVWVVPEDVGSKLGDTLGTPWKG